MKEIEIHPIFFAIFLKLNKSVSKTIPQKNKGQLEMELIGITLPKRSLSC
jgi:hypothetical protein